MGIHSIGSALGTARNNAIHEGQDSLGQGCEARLCCRPHGSADLLGKGAFQSSALLAATVQEAAGCISAADRWCPMGSCRPRVLLKEALLRQDARRA